MCHVTTTDFKTYYVSLSTWFDRSDGRKVHVDDVFFTYNDIVKNNIWNIPFLNWYKDIIVSQTLDSRVKVIFPNPSVDNNIFFTNYVLPKHIVGAMKYEDYKQIFGLEPIYNQCAVIWSNTKDQYSLVFDVSNCDNTFLGFYQLKSNESFDVFKKLIAVENDSIIDMYEDKWAVTWYVKQPIKTNKLVTIFFNTNSPKLQVRQRRTLGWLIANTFYNNSWYKEYLQKYDSELFTNFVTDWKNIKDFLVYKSVWSPTVVSKVNLVWTDTKLLPASISISWTNKKFAFYVENVKDKINLKLNFDQEYDRVSIENNKNEYFPKTYKKKEKKTEYNIAKSLNNLVEWLNKYDIYWYIWKEKINIASIDLYNIQWTKPVTDATLAVQTPTNSSDKIIVVYYNNDLYTFVVDQLKAIFAQYGVLDHFVFQPVWSIQELEGKLTADEYDIVINSIDMWLKKDISKLFATEKKEVNHSQYTNTQLVSYLQQYLNIRGDVKAQKSLQQEINSVYGEHMPFVMLGDALESIYIKKPTYDKLSKYNKTLFDTLYDFNRRQLVYENLVLANNVNIDISQAQNFKNFTNFLKNSFK